MSVGPPEYSIQPGHILPGAETTGSFLPSVSVPFAVPPAPYPHERAILNEYAPPSGFAEETSPSGTDPDVIYQASAGEPPAKPPSGKSPTPPRGSGPAVSPERAQRLLLASYRAEAAQRRVDRGRRIDWESVRSDPEALMPDRLLSVVNAIRGDIAPGDVNIVFQGLRGSYRAGDSEPPLIYDRQLNTTVSSALQQGLIAPDDVPGAVLLANFTELPPTVPISTVLRNFQIVVAEPDPQRLPVEPDRIQPGSLSTMHMSADLVDPTGKVRARMQREMNVYIPTPGTVPEAGQSSAYRQYYTPAMMRGEAGPVMRFNMNSLGPSGSKGWRPIVERVIQEYRVPLEKARQREVKAAEHPISGGIPGEKRTH